MYLNKLVSSRQWNKLLTHIHISFTSGRINRSLGLLGLLRSLVSLEWLGLLWLLWSEWLSYWQTCKTFTTLDSGEECVLFHNGVGKFLFAKTTLHGGQAKQRRHSHHLKRLFSEYGCLIGLGSMDALLRAVPTVFKMKPKTDRALRDSAERAYTCELTFQCNIWLFSKYTRHM